MDKVVNETIKDTWDDASRIGPNTPTYQKERLLDIEDYIIKKSEELGIDVKFNFKANTGGMLHPLDKSVTSGMGLESFNYNDLLNGILISTNDIF